jgi:hypothetical protein
VGPRAGLDTEARGKILCPRRGSNPDRPVVQPVVLSNNFRTFVSVGLCHFYMKKILKFDQIWHLKQEVRNLLGSNLHSVYILTHTV